MPSFTILYLFTLFYVTTAQYDDLSILEEVLDRTTLPTVDAVDSKVTVESISDLLETMKASSTVAPTAPEVATTAGAMEELTKSMPEMEKKNESKGIEIEVTPIVSTPLVEFLQSTTEESATTTHETSTSSESEIKVTSTEATLTSIPTEIPAIEKEPLIGLGKPDLSRIYRRLFPYRNI
ncbi:unnamed protein product [Strongylus vulgaris]|uniref:Uncharacterized protein n=1 Tax=Strongylus vulgaris TaxID=40348 RepID=A0A3P7LD66_STRVU|nr:unnamed protein product [Strongylus vulgaris]